ncbi:hypothetical protein [Rhizobium leguminosarum]|uniref:hypothetical protein n=1 Tax=Rhizobium leguminosarum TaxID=384 RepID=UPI00103CF4F2|nr:hypothetical protein [Rhizobium leguminosarum]TBZ07835.1 hypothetical protein E0H33_29475 [Rhizobium leguminosarum bv. viciae]
MARFSKVFKLPGNQSTFDFVDIDLSKDTRLYLDPYAIQIREDEWSAKCGDYIRSFFVEVLGALRDENDYRVIHLLSQLHEPNETYLGESRGKPSGRGWGNDKAALLAQALRNSRAFNTGLIGDISEAELFIRGVGPDMISDLTTNVLRGLLADYTAQQCELHNVPLHAANALGPIWNPARRDWEAQQLLLPRYARRPILLVPKFSVRFRLSLDSQEFYNKHMIEYLRSEYLQAGGALVETLKNKKKVVYKYKVEEKHPLIKDDLAAFAAQHPDILEFYKSLKGAAGPLASGDIDKFFNEREYALLLANALAEIPTGNKDASNYHNHSLAICTFLFYPHLITPVKEAELHEGRKRLDIRFSNSAESGFFYKMMAGNQTRSMNVAVECKNYQKQIANPELDQLSGRFGHQRGFFGMLLCRSMDDRKAIIKRCRDTANDQRGYIIVLEDTDLVTMLNYVADGRRAEIDKFLDARFAEITH